MILRTFILLGLLLGLLGAPGESTRASVDELIQGLQSGDEASLARARQLLPHHGIDAVDRVIPLLENPDERIWRTAFNILADFAAEVTQPGREQERATVAAAYMKLVLPAASNQQREWGLRLLPRVVPDDFDLAPLGELLRDEDWREKARATLAEIGSPAACAILRNELAQADPDFQIAILRALGHLRDKESLPALANLLESKLPEVRSAAALAISSSGDATYLPQVRRTVDTATPDTRDEAIKALVQLAESIAADEANHPTAAEVYRFVLDASASDPLTNAAIVGLGNVGVFQDVKRIVDKVSGPQGAALEPSAAQAFRSMTQPESRQAWANIFPNLSESLRYALLAAMGERFEEVFMEALVDSGEGGSPQIQSIAYEALAQSGSPSAIGPLVSFSESAQGPDRDRARALLGTLATRLEASGSPEGAHEVYVALYHAASTDDQKSAALEGVSRFPTIPSFRILLEGSSKGTASLSVCKALGALAEKFRAAGDTAKAEQATAALIANAKSGEGIQLVHAALSAGGDAQKASRALGFILDWRVGTPKPWQASQGLNDEVVGAPVFDLAQLKDWKEVHVEGFPPIVNLAAILGQQDNLVVDAYALIDSPSDQDVVFLFGSDDGIKAWLNGEAIHENSVDRGAAVDQDRAPARLKSGTNQLMVRVTQGGGGWAFVGRLTLPDGTPIQIPKGAE